MPSAVWTEDMDATLRQCASDGLTAKQCAELVTKVHGIAITRNGAIGRAHRKGIHFESGKTGGFPSPAPTPKPLARIGRPPKAPPQPTLREIAPKPEPVAVTTPGGGVRFADLRPNGCRYALGALLDRPEFFCGKPNDRASAYCAEHAAICFNAPARPVVSKRAA